MSAIVTDQFRIFNANNFISSIDDSSNSYYVFLGLPNSSSIGFGRTTNWNSNIPSPIDNFDYENHYHETMMFGKKITSLNVRRLVRRIDWVKGTKYEMYRHDYSVLKPSPITNSSRLYDANYYVMNSDYRVYICIDNGSSGTIDNGSSETNPRGNSSQDEPKFTELEPSKAGESGDGYLWKYLFTVSPSDVIKFDSTEYITIPNSWDSSTDSQVVAVRENGNSDVNNNQIKKVYIESRGSGYSSGLSQPFNIIGDGVGAKVLVDVVNGKITNTKISSGGSGYTYGMVDLGAINLNAKNSPAKLIPIIPPSKGHGYNLYKELGADKVLIYARFDDSSKDFPIDTKFSQIGIVKNPTSYGSDVVFTENQYSSLYAIKFSSVTGSVSVGDKISQTITGVGIAYGYVASYDADTKVIKYFQDRTSYFNKDYIDQTDYSNISSNGNVLSFTSNSSYPVTTSGGFSGTIDTSFNRSTINPTGNKIINLGITFNSGLSNPEINKESGDIIYIDNRPEVSRNSRQKEDVKIILEF